MIIHRVIVVLIYHMSRFLSFREDLEWPLIGACSRPRHFDSKMLHDYILKTSLPLSETSSS